MVSRPVGHQALKRFAGLSVSAARSAQTWIRHRGSRFSCLPSVSGFRFGFSGLFYVGLLTKELSESNFPFKFRVESIPKIRNHESSFQGVGSLLINRIYSWVTIDSFALKLLSKNRFMVVGIGTALVKKIQCSCSGWPTGN